MLHVAVIEMSGVLVVLSGIAASFLLASVESLICTIMHVGIFLCRNKLIIHQWQMCLPSVTGSCCIQVSFLCTMWTVHHGDTGMAVLVMLSLATLVKRRLHHIQHRVMDHLTKTSFVAIGHSAGGLGLGASILMLP